MSRDYDYPAELAKQAVENVSSRGLTLRENITHDLTRAKANVARLEELAKLIDENPSTSRILELMGQR